jgi:hypothetical protein
MAEIWKDIPGYEGRYQASTEGHIRSVDRVIDMYSPLIGRVVKRPIKGRVLRPGRNNSGHYSVTLGHGAHGSLVHYLVLKTFVGERPDGMDIRHLNGNPCDNRLCNLAYGTRTENILDVYRVGKRWRKLSLDDAKRIKQLLRAGLSETQIAIMFDCSLSAISNIKRGRTYTWLCDY